MSSYQLISKPIVVNERMERLIAEGLAEVDREQINLRRSWTPAQRAQCAMEMIRASEKAAVDLLRQQEPHLGEIEALRQVRLRAHKEKERLETWRKK